MKNNEQTGFRRFSSGFPWFRVYRKRAKKMKHVKSKRETKITYAYICEQDQRKPEESTSLLFLNFSLEMLETRVKTLVNTLVKSPGNKNTWSTTVVNNFHVTLKT